MKPYITNIAITLRLMSRERAALVFGYVFPLIFFFLFAQVLEAGQSGAVAKQVVTSVLIFGVLGNGFFGAGMRAVSDREQNILRRYKAVPTTAAPLLTGWLITGYVNYLPSALFLIGLGHFAYHMPWPDRPFTLFVFLSVSVLAFRSMGLILASVVNSMQESQILIQLFYLPMLFLSGATFPLSSMPQWVQVLAQFLPASHLFGGLQGIMLRQEGLAEHWKSLLALLLTLVVGLFLSTKLFRWEKEDKVPGRAKLWVVAALAPFLVLGVYQAFSKESLTRAKVMQRELRRSRTLLIRDARLFVGDGKVVERGALLIKDGKIAAVYESEWPEPKTLNAEPVEGSGKTLLPGLIDASVQMTAPAVDGAAGLEKTMERIHAAYLYCGVTAIQSVGYSAAAADRLRGEVARGERLGSEIFFTGPKFTTREAIGNNTLIQAAAGELFRLPASAAEAAVLAQTLRRAGANMLYADTGSLAAPIVQALRGAGLPLLASANYPGAAALLAADSPPATGYWIPELTALEIKAEPRPELFEGSLLQQVLPPDLRLTGGRPLAAADAGSAARLAARMAAVPGAAGRIVAGSGSGQPMVFHGPGVHRELALLVRAGLSPSDALQSATGRAAALLGAAGRIGKLQPGMEANLLLVDGNPLRDITVTERISSVFFRGERVPRATLLESEEQE